jgi:hypothetical protein
MKAIKQTLNERMRKKNSYYLNKVYSLKWLPRLFLFFRAKQNKFLKGLIL